MKKHLLFLFCFPAIYSFCYAQEPTLWGCTLQGGTNNFGIIFNYNCSNGNETIVHNFINNLTDGLSPSTTFIRGTNGLLYGLTSDGGTNYGTIFSYDISTGTETVLHNFGIGTDGSDAISYMMQANNNLLYGMTHAGGIDGRGILFSYNITTDVEMDLHDFGSSNDGNNPDGSVIQASNGLLYGVTGTGGAYGGGILFSYDILTNTYTKLYDFLSVSNDAGDPQGTLIQLNNGLLYGTSVGGGSYGYGTIFSYNISTGVETVLYSFGNGTDGTNPLYDKLLVVSDSLLYGMTQSGGVYSRGIILIIILLQE